MVSDYSKGKIYKIYNEGLEDICYIGSTIKELKERLNGHKTKSNQTKSNQYASSILFEEGNNPIIELLENFPCENKSQLLERERYWMDKYPDVVNKNRPLLTIKEKKLYYSKWYDKIRVNKK